MDEYLVEAFELAFTQLINDASENKQSKEKAIVRTALGRLKIGKINYQLQLSLSPTNFLEPDETRFEVHSISEMIKIEPNN